MRQKATNQTVKKNFILYKGHTGWKIKTRIFGTLLVSLSAVALAETIGTADVHAATAAPSTPAADSAPVSDAEKGNSTTLSTSKTTTPTAQAAPVAESADVSTESAAGAATSTTSDKQYQTLTPDQSMSVGKTDGSGVTLSGSQVQDHFTNWVENLNKSGDNSPEISAANTSSQAADAKGVWQLTTTKPHIYKSPTMPDFPMTITGPEVAHVAFENEIDFSHNFTMDGALGIGTKTSGGADGVGIVFAPGDPEYATTGETGGNLGLGGLKNAFAFVYDDHHNGGDDTSGVVDPGSGAYFGWRSTDGDGAIQKVTDSNAWKAASTFDLSNRAASPLIDFKMNYDSGTKMLTVIIKDQTFTRDLTGIDTSKGYSISIAASTGQDSNDYSAKIDSFTYTPKTATVSVNVATAAGDVSTKTPVTANIGDTISVFSTKAAAERAVAADPTLDPSLVTVIPDSTNNNVYLVDGDNTAASTGTVNHITGEASIADAAYYSYKVTGDTTQAFSVPVTQAFTANITPVDSVTGDAIPGMDPIQVPTVAGKSVVVQVPGYTPVTVVVDAPTDGTVANANVKINTGTTASTDTDVANPIQHYYTATGETMDGTKVTTNATVGTNQSVTDALNATPIGEDGKAVTDGSTPAYTWSTVPNAAGTDSTDSTAPQDTKSILVPTKATLDEWLQKATDNQAKADDYQKQTQAIYDKFVGLTGITQDQKDAAKKLLDSVNDMYTNLSTSNATAKAALKAAEDSTDPETIFENGQAGYNALANMDDTLTTFQTDLDNLTSTNEAAVKALATFVSWSQDYGQTVGIPDVTVGADFGADSGATLTTDQKAGFANPDFYYYVSATDSDTHVTPKDAGTYYFQLTDAGRNYLKSLTTNTNAGLYTPATLTINPVDAKPTITDTSLQYGGVDGKLDGVKYALGTVAGDDDSRLNLTQDDFEIDDANGNQVAVKDLQVGGKYTIRYSDATQTALKADGNYNFGTFGTAILTVTPRKVMLVAADAGKTYGDSTDPALSLDGDSAKAAMVNGDEVSSLGVVLKRDKGEDADTYAIKGTAIGNKNYEVTITPGTFTIDPKVITVQANNVSVDYDGKAHQVDQSGFTIADGDKLVGTDTAADLDVTLTPTAETDAGTYTISGSSTAKNYKVTVLDGTLTINQKDATVTADAATVGYGDDLPTFTVTDSDTGLKTTLDNTDFEIFDNKTNAVATGQLQAGGDYTIRLTQKAQDSLTTANPNYKLSFGANKLTVTQRAITVHVEDGGKDYGVTTDPALTFTIPATTATGEANGTLAPSDTQDNLGVTLTREAGDNAGKYNITGTAANDGNYNVSIENTGTFTIAQAAGTATVDSNASVVYGDNLSSVNVTVNGKDSTRDASDFEIVDDAGNVVNVKENPLQAGGKYTLRLTTDAQAALSKANPNYALSFVAGGLTVRKRPITVTINDVNGVDDGTGTVHESGGYRITDGKLAGNDTTGALGVTLTNIKETSAGTYTITGTADSANYDVTLKDGTMKILGTATDANGNKTVTEKDSDGNVIRIDKQWADGSETTYTFDPKTGDRDVSEQKHGAQVGKSQPLTSAAKVILSDGDNENTSTIVALDPETNQPTFEHDTTVTDPDDKTTTTTDDKGNVVKVVKTWPDESKTTYAFDPSTGIKTVTEEKPEEEPVTQTFGKDVTQATVKQGNTDTTVTTTTPGAQPTFAHDTTTTDPDTNTTTTKDADGNVIKVVKTWPGDKSKTTYTFDPSTGDQTVTEEKDGEDPVTQKFADGATQTTVKQGNTDTTVTATKPGDQPTFAHDITTTDPDTNTTTTKDADGNVIKAVKTWPGDKSKTTYTFDPSTGDQTVTEEKDGEDPVTQKFNEGATETTVKQGNTDTTVTATKPGDQPTFAHDTTTTDPDTNTTTTKDADGNVIKAVKTWPGDKSKTTYTFDPSTGDQTVTEEKDGEDPVTQKFANGATQTTVKQGNTDTTVTATKPGDQPTFAHDITTTDPDTNTTTTKDADGNVIKAVKTWPGDKSKTTYTFDPSTGDQTVTEEKDGEDPVTQKFTDGATQTTVKQGNTDTTVTATKPGDQPTFAHDITTTDPDTNTTTTKDADGNVIKAVKTWPGDKSKTTYTFDPSTGDQTVTEEKDGEDPVTQKFNEGATQTTVKQGNTDTTVTATKPGDQPTFAHDTTTTDDKTNTTTTKDADGNVIKAVKTWPGDKSKTTYTFDPSTGDQTVTEEKDGEDPVTQKFTEGTTETTVKQGNTDTTVATTKPGDQPTFEHDTTTTAKDKTATTTNANGDVIKVVKPWTDGSQTIYTFDPATGDRMVTEQRNGKTVDQKPIVPGTPVTLSDGAGGTATVKFGDSDTTPTFTHNPAAPAPVADKVVKVTKQWPDGLQVIYTYDPTSGSRTVSELRDGKLVDQQTIEPGALSVTLPDGKDGSTIIKFDKTGTVPTFTRQLADKINTNTHKVTSRKKAGSAKAKKLRKQAAAVKPLALSKANRYRVSGASAADTIATGRTQSQRMTKLQQASQQDTELPQTDEKSQGSLVALGLLMLSGLMVPFRRKRHED